jgi:long-chain fatty acid transport protein
MSFSVSLRQRECFLRRRFRRNENHWKEAKVRKVIILGLCLVLLLGMGGAALATNGDNLIGVGPVSRAMGGVGVAAPQDAISAVFANPAAMCFGPYCPGSEFNFGGTLFMPDVRSKITIGPGPAITADSDKKVYMVPAIGISVPITSDLPLWRFGLAAYGVTGLGVDYRNTAVDAPTFFPAPSPPFPAGTTFPLVAGEYTQLQIMKFSPTIAYQPTDKFSIGLGLQIDFSSLDLRSGTSFNYGVGAQLGVLYKFSDMFSVGAVYVTPQPVKHENVRDFDGDGTADDLKLAAPQQVALGIAVAPVSNLLLAVDGRWINWSNADGYDDFDWDDQWVLAVGAQFKPVEKLALRAGYNYGKNPVKDHSGTSGFNGATMVTVQGKSMPTYYYETFRIIGFPAIVEHHMTAGIGYSFTNNFELNLGYMHAFENNVKETGTLFDGATPVALESTLSEDSVEFGLTWRF